MIKVSQFQRLLSYLIPVKIWEGSGKDSTSLELSLYQGQWQLATNDALYSDGAKYRPILLAFRKLKAEVHQWKSMLVLGAGLGSAVHVAKSMGLNLQTTLIDNDPTVLNLAQRTLETKRYDDNVQFVLNDAEQFISQTIDRWDIIIVDVFKGRVVPEFVTSELFIRKCRKCLSTHGTVIINYMIHSETDWKAYKATIESLFGNVQIIELGINRIIIAKA